MTRTIEKHIDRQSQKKFKTQKLIVDKLNKENSKLSRSIRSSIDKLKASNDSKCKAVSQECLSWGKGLIARFEKGREDFQSHGYHKEYATPQDN